MLDYIFNTETLRALLLTLLAFLVAYFFTYLSSSTKKSANLNLSDDTVVFITAHPDDECMFLGPSILQLAERKPKNLHLLCLTTGNYYKEGHIRQKELYKSCKILGIPDTNIHILDNSSFLDGPQEWDFSALLPELLEYQRRVKPDYIFTFDDFGVSGHTNHIATSNAVREMCKHLQSESKIPVIFELESVPIYRKYLSFLDAPFIVMSSRISFISSPSGVLKAQRAMCAHKSQLVWFRWLYIIFSRYMLINTFKEVTLESSPNSS